MRRSSDPARPRRLIRRGSARKPTLDEQLEGPLTEYRRTKANLDDVERRCDLARRYDRKLGQVSSGKERAKIHEECRFDLGTSIPRKFIKENEPQILRLRRDADKQERRVQSIIRRGTMEPKNFIMGLLHG